ncbi:ADP,ATP carrier protein 3, mitochondrial [Dendrobium catenatum]|uniref:ADP,ATP carrier protein 3, mitochondrial n=1 Tax=Dendrobium catenatum TaxID=906689 RepID=A0A2I0VWE2_9ASPA|nr:ADP,ATP carrier protein 3, mitochondrial [Dendrobium catenatum]
MTVQKSKGTNNTYTDQNSEIYSWTSFPFPEPENHQKTRGVPRRGQPAVVARAQPAAVSRGPAARVRDAGLARLCNGDLKMTYATRVRDGATLRHREERDPQGEKAVNRWPSLDQLIMEDQLNYPSVLQKLNGQSYFVSKVAPYSHARNSSVHKFHCPGLQSPISQNFHGSFAPIGISSHSVVASAPKEAGATGFLIDFLMGGVSADISNNS